MAQHESYQAHCRTCAKVFEASTAEAAIRKALVHEREMAVAEKDGKVDARHREVRG